MANFDFVESASKGYKFLWDERILILRLATIPFAIKLASFIGVTCIDFNENYLRHGLFLLPSYFVEGWLIMQLIRFAILGERGQANFIKANFIKANSTKDEINNQNDELFQARRRGILAGIIIYVISKLLLSFFSALILMNVPTQETVASSNITDTQSFIIGTAMLLVMIWGFRFVWLYIPAALDYSVSNFLHRIKSFTSSFSMIGLWLLSFVPIMLLLLTFSKILATTFPGVEEDIASVTYRYGMAVVQGVLDLVIAIVSSIGMAYGIQSIYNGTNKPTAIL